MATTVFTALQLPPTVLEPYREAFLTWMQELSDCMSARTHSSTVRTSGMLKCNIPDTLSRSFTISYRLIPRCFSQAW